MCPCIRDAWEPEPSDCWAARITGKYSWRSTLGDDSPLGRACRRATTDLQNGRGARSDLQFLAEAKMKVLEHGWAKTSQAVTARADRRNSAGPRQAPAPLLGGLRNRPATPVLIAALPDDDWHIAWACSSALNRIESRRDGRKLAEVLRRDLPALVRQAAIYSIWMLGETRAESELIRIGEAIDREEEHTRSMAVEALGNTNRRLKTQRALAARLFDPSVDVRYSALC